MSIKKYSVCGHTLKVHRKLKNRDYLVQLDNGGLRTMSGHYMESLEDGTASSIEDICEDFQMHAEGLISFMHDMEYPEVCSEEDFEDAYNMYWDDGYYGADIVIGWAELRLMMLAYAKKNWRC